MTSFSLFASNSWSDVIRLCVCQLHLPTKAQISPPLFSLPEEFESVCVCWGGGREGEGGGVEAMGVD